MSTQDHPGKPESDLSRDIEEAMADTHPEAASRSETPVTQLSDSAAASQDARGQPEQAASQPAERIFVGTGLFWGLLFGVIVAAAFIVLAAQNTVETPVRFLSWEMTTPLIALILVSFVAGVLLDEVVGLVYRARRRRILQDREELRALREREEG